MAVAVRLARRELQRRPFRALMVVLIVAGVVGGILCADLAVRSRRNDSIVGFGRAEVKMTARLQTADDTRDPMQLLLSSVPAAVERVTGWEAPMPVPLQRRDDPTRAASGVLWTVDLTQPLLRGAIQLDRGSVPASSSEVLLGTRLAAELGLGVGDTLHLTRPRLDLRIAGIGDSPGQRELFVAPGYPIDEIVPSERIGVAYLASLVPNPNLSARGGANDVSYGFTRRVRFDRNPVVDTLVSWLTALLVLGVLGVVVSSAFATSGRRQLVSLGQLGAVGADRRVLRRFLGLQGGIIGLVGALVGVGCGWWTAKASSAIVADGRWDLPWLHPALLVVTTAGVATLAALVPTRRLANAPVLTALSGRAPVARLWPRQLHWAVVAVGWGLLVLGFSVLGTYNRSHVASTFSVCAALVGGGAVLGGVCGLAPVAIERWGRLADRFSGSSRLALRSLDRNRARSAAIVAAIIAVVAGGVAGASSVERRTTDGGVYQPFQTRLDVVEITSNSVRHLKDTGLAPTTAPVPASERAAVEAIVGSTQWHDLRFVRAQGLNALVIDRDVLTVLGVPADAVNRVLAAKPRLLSREPLSGKGVLVIRQLATYGQFVVTADEAAAAGMPQVGSGALGFTQRPLTDVQRVKLSQLQDLEDQAAKLFDGATSDGAAAGFTIVAQIPDPGPPFIVTRTMARWFLIAGLLLLVTLIIAAGLVLWAVEGRAERDQLVALGASPTALAGVAALRAWVLSATGAVIAVPVGLGALWAVMHALDRPVPIPVVTVLMVVLALPLLAAGVSYAGSLIAQTVRPATGTTLSLD
jgi:ABC-type lipoprotein release transport system permease subunit